MCKNRIILSPQSYLLIINLKLFTLLKLIRYYYIFYYINNILKLYIIFNINFFFNYNFVI